MAVGVKRKAVRRIGFPEISNDVLLLNLEVWRSIEFLIARHRFIHQASVAVQTIRLF